MLDQTNILRDYQYTLGKEYMISAIFQPDYLIGRIYRRLLQ